MRLDELLLQGVKGFPARARLALGPGHVVLRAPGTVVLGPLVDLLLYGGGPGAERLAAPGSAEVRLALGFTGRGGGRYRLLRDLGGAAALLRADAAGAFVPHSRDPAEIADHLRAEEGLPPREVFRDGLLLAAAFLPSLSAFEEALPAAGAIELVAEGEAVAFPGFGGFGGFADEEPDLDPAARLDALRTEREHAVRVEALQAEHDAASADLHAADERLRAGVATAAGLDEVRAARAAFAAHGLDPATLRDRLAGYAAAERRHRDDLAALDVEGERLRDAAARGGEGDLLRDGRFWGSLAGGAALLLAGAFSPVRSLALLDIPLFGFAAFLAVRHLGGLRARESLGRRERVLDDRARRIEARREAETAEVRRAMKLLDAGTIAALEERLDEALALAAREASLEAEVRRLAADPAHRRDRAERERLAAEVRRLEGELGPAAAGYHRTVAELDRAIAAAEDRLAGGPAEPARAPPAGARTPGFVPLDLRALEAAARLLGGAPGDLAVRVEGRSGEWLRALSAGRLALASLSPDLGLVVRLGGAETAFALLPPAERDLAYLALRLALLERAAPARPLPFVLDDPFGGLDAGRRALVGKALAALGTRAQLLHRTPSPELVAAATRVVEPA